ncbi:MAG: hypothetical protein ABJG15_09430 [Hyphomonadaceae bacterium]
MDLEDGLTPIERTGARMFFNVSVQSAFALEDPNMRFGTEFNNADAREAGQAKTMAEVVHKVYHADIDGGSVAFESNPPNTPALSRVVVQGGGAVAIIDAVLAGFKAAEYFTPLEQKPLERSEDAPVRENVGNRMVRLVISDKVAAEHDVAALFSWSSGSDKKMVLEMMAWPINKNADLRT